jgi:hypothetical protein
MMPIMVIIFSGIKLGVENRFENEIKSYHTIMAVLSLLMQLLLYLFTENFFFCFFPNMNIPWSKPTSRVDFTKFIVNIAYAVLLTFSEENGTAEIVLFCLIAVFQLGETIIQFMSIPYYSFYIDKALLIPSSFLSYIYITGVIRSFLQIKTSKISFMIIFSINFLFLMLFIYKIRVTFIRRKFLKSNKGVRDFQI